MKKSLKYFRTRKAKNKKGNITDVLYLVGFLLIVGIGLLVASFTLSQVKTALNSTNTDNTTAEYLEQSESKFNSSFDNMFLMIYVISSITIVISALFIRSSPIFVIIFILALLVILFVSFAGSKIFEVVAEQDFLNTTITQLPKTNYIMDNMIIFLGITAVLTIIALVINTGGEY